MTGWATRRPVRVGISTQSIGGAPFGAPKMCKRSRKKFPGCFPCVPAPAISSIPAAPSCRASAAMSWTAADESSPRPHRRFKFRLNRKSGFVASIPAGGDHLDQLTGGVDDPPPLGRTSVEADAGSGASSDDASSKRVLLVPFRFTPQHNKISTKASNNQNLGTTLVMVSDE